MQPKGPSWTMAGAVGILGGQWGARSSGRHHSITLETRNAGARCMLKALIQLPELRWRPAAGGKGVLQLSGEGRGGFVWEELGKRDFSAPLLAEGQLPASAALRWRAPARSPELSGAVPTSPASTEGKTSPWIKRPCKPVLATPRSFISDKDGRLAGLPPLSPPVL